MIILDNQRQVRSSPCSCGQSFVQGTSSPAIQLITLVCPSCHFTYTVNMEVAEQVGIGTIWDAIIAVRGPSRFWPQRGWQPAQMPPTPEQPFGVRHNLPPPKPPEPISPEPIKEIPREYDRYELLELDKNTVQKELTFEGDWFMHIELN